MSCLDTVSRRECCVFIGPRQLTPLQEAMLPLQILPVVSELYHHAGVRTFLCACEPGFDLVAAHCVLSTRDGDGGFEGLRLVAVLPDRRPVRGLSKPQREQHNRVLAGADAFFGLFSRIGPQNRGMRDRFLIDHAAYCIHYINDENGREAQLLQHARDRGVYAKAVGGLTLERQLSVLWDPPGEHLLEWLRRD